MSTRTSALAVMGAAVNRRGRGVPNTERPNRGHEGLRTPVSTTGGVATPTGVAMTRQPCDLLTPAVAKKYVGDKAERQLFYDSTPPVPVGDDACHYTGSTREVSVAIYPMPTDPTAPVNPFDVIRPQNRVDGLSFKAYRFGAAESIVAVKGGLLISVKVANIEGASTDQDRSDDIELANLIVPQVG